MASGSPSLALLLLEPTRAILEAATLPGATPLLRRSQRGDGHPVLVLPGFMASDRSTRWLRRALKAQGYGAHPWLLGQNMGPTDDMEDRLADRIAELAKRYGEKVSIVGWSLGGIYARELAKAVPDQVRQVITLGSPFANTDRRSNATSLFDRVNKSRKSPRAGRTARSLREAPDVPCTAIFSRTDGIVHWSACLEAEAPQTENIEVPGSHCGLGMNPLVIYAVLDRLAQAADAWKPFERDGWRQHVYPEAPGGQHSDA